ncbi:cysteine desulfurase-like protein [Nodularia spumigena CS-584]|jgi:cysteine desulfurase family protein (TIGR01976 family)|uniref:Cysteine desulfurase SufS n=2 Tax=Nodularia spumigena TaxID=70799 RepID=A0A2S0QB14_NODSP|nr:cysteine desulfurase-like protein [Nodularia spumigena]AHJ28527.1 Cysteine desulfurase [Nodularia spumigena CCY9414]AVZ31548.1 cysteine desulfurase SufS [Nodularia spumigena UHCC 0039]EAW44620.1 probable aminotransferase [Nodularia spumigena CCY9414]MDB9381262.1 cysteine desulfurase-like protein [Nodularia spumigena CS-584]MEA5526284.1 cysteine desulfurase-like protein [Nodularia spumigena UHCC 0143]
MFLNIDKVRPYFPALAGDWTFFDNAGGSQTLKKVVDRISEFLLTTDVQLGASYAVSQLAGERVALANGGMATLINAKSPQEVVMGSSTTMMLKILSLCLSQTFTPGDEVIVTNCDHEANIGAWVALEKQGITVKVWQVRPDTLELHLEDLELLMSGRTKLVALTHASNILGTINPIKEITAFVHERGAMVCVDGVAYAPHRLIDVQDLDVDFYVLSCYKVYGSHCALLYGKKEHLFRIPGLNHYFIEQSDIPYKFQLGNLNFELTYGMLGLCDYLSELAQLHYGDDTAPDLRGQMAQVFDLISVHEENLSDRLLKYLNSRPKIRVIGKSTAHRELRVPTISFTVDGVHSSTIPPKVDSAYIGIRYGDFYAKRLIEYLGLATQGGIIRVSMVHYNTLAEVDRLIEALERVLI